MDSKFNRAVKLFKVNSKGANSFKLDNLVNKPSSKADKSFRVSSKRNKAARLFRVSNKDNKADNLFKASNSNNSRTLSSNSKPINGVKIPISVLEMAIQPPHAHLIKMETVSHVLAVTASDSKSGTRAIEFNLNNNNGLASGLSRISTGWATGTTVSGIQARGTSRWPPKSLVMEKIILENSLSLARRPTMAQFTF